MQLRGLLQSYPSSPKPTRVAATLTAFAPAALISSISPTSVTPLPVTCPAYCAIAISACTSASASSTSALAQPWAAAISTPAPQTTTTTSNCVLSKV